MDSRQMDSPPFMTVGDGSKDTLMTRCVLYGNPTYDQPYSLPRKISWIQTDIAVGIRAIIPAHTGRN
jgi:hypothetical protein